MYVWVSLLRQEEKTLFCPKYKNVNAYFDCIEASSSVKYGFLEWLLNTVTFISGFPFSRGLQMPEIADKIFSSVTHLYLGVMTSAITNWFNGSGKKTNP